jgi:SAM-dependent methyltransferase
MTVQDQFGQIDIYVFDQILRGNLQAEMRVLDAGCGFGRNLVYLLREGAEIFAVDASGEAVEHVRALAGMLAPALPTENFKVSGLEAMPFEDEFFDAVICNSVLHFARNQAQFLAMVRELWRVLKPAGLLFCRLGSRIGMEFDEVRDGIFEIGDGSEWFLVDEEQLMDLTEELGGVMADPLKTTVVQDYRCMTTWVLRKRR